tara:strand:+ start:1035 stop:1631 length:597 start_codon:yes stop_codon:yes gene_type:complete
MKKVFLAAVAAIIFPVLPAASQTAPENNWYYLMDQPGAAAVDNRGASLATSCNESGNVVLTLAVYPDSEAYDLFRDGLEIARSSNSWRTDSDFNMTAFKMLTSVDNSSFVDIGTPAYFRGGHAGEEVKSIILIRAFSAETGAAQQLLSLFREIRAAKTSITVRVNAPRAGNVSADFNFSAKRSTAAMEHIFRVRCSDL